MKPNSISLETQATILMTTRLGETGDDLKPLSPAEFRSVQRWLCERGLTLGNLLSTDHRAVVDAMIAEGVGTALIPSLLDRVDSLSRAIDHWSAVGIWVIGETDDDYPERLKHRLGSTGFPLLFGAGQREFLTTGGVYIVGSRNTSDTGLAFSKTLAARCGAEGITVISSDMRGADREAIGAASAAGGNIICVLSDSLEKAVVAKRHRELLEQGKLTVITPFSPDTRFRVANAIRVSRYQYCLGDFAVIVETRRTGGVWLGAEENRKENWVPAFVRADDTVPLGNEALLSLGYMPLAENEVSGCDEIGAYLISRLTTASARPPSVTAGPGDSANEIGALLFNIFCEKLAAFAGKTARSPEEIQDYFRIEPEQAEAWIAQALEDGLLEDADDADQYKARPSNQRH
ncbi:MAG: hypothetical protein HOB37_16135 [Rhodospirillaceae bacterium]|jgi:predicted Rossmann fold nucleotide-binding protein DprA/Smf involved in DNA uptake|nr:hypothetical protein [Rhodospirillaceae bacterium]MBT6609965.1 hypothetical protein [Rhodospirillaceae bacterium]